MRSLNGSFTDTCYNVMQVLRKNTDSLMAVLEAFVHDPLFDWSNRSRTSEEGLCVHTA